MGLGVFALAGLRARRLRRWAGGAGSMCLCDVVVRIRVHLCVRRGAA